MAENQTSFKPGKSGNPNGRPKKGNSWKDVLSEAMEKEHTIGGEKKTLKQIIGDVLSKKATKGDLKAIEMIMDRLDGKPTQHQVVDVNKEKMDELKDMLDVKPEAE